MKYLITGAAGFVGFHVARKLLEEGNTVSGVDNLNDYYDLDLKRSRLEELKKFKKFIFYNQDIAYKSLEIDFENLELIIHLAAQAGVRFSLTNPRNYLHSNINGHFEILEVCRMHSIPLIYASSSSVYGDHGQEKFSEDSIGLSQKSFYGFTKMTCERMSDFYAKNFNFSQIGLRFFTVYGEYGRPDMAYWKFTKNILEKKKIIINGNGNQIRDFTYISDTVSGIINAVNYIKNSSNMNQVFNLGNEDPKSINQLIDAIEKELKIKAIRQYEGQIEGDVIRTSSDNSLARKYLKYNPQISLDYGIKKFISWYISYNKAL